MKNKKTRNICDCGRKIVYFTNKKKGKAKYDKDHTLCMRCYRSHRNRTRKKDRTRRKNDEHQ